MVNRVVSKLYQYYRLTASILYACLLLRCLTILFLVGPKYLPNMIHEFLCYLMVIYSCIELFFMIFVFRSIKFIPLVKCIDFLYFVVVLNFHDDYEHAPILKNMSYPIFIITMSIVQIFEHWTKLFKTHRMSKRNNSMFGKLRENIITPVMVISQFYLFILNLHKYDNYHTTDTLDKLNNVVLVLYIPIALFLFKNRRNDRFYVNF
ncbi:hypothetical protein ACO0RG_000410 [Hanseniaspora osmophila]